MTVEGAQIAGSAAARTAARDWKALRDSGDIQFEKLPPFKPPETPDWLQELGEWLRALFEPVGEALGFSWPVVQKILLAMAILLVLILLWVLLRPIIERLVHRGRATQNPEWAPDRDAAVALLEDADRLAGEGRFAEAVHLLLQRSVHHIAEARPDWLLPASTAREIAAFPMLPERARTAFSVIATRVERSLFALRGLDEADWQAARNAYSNFALAELPA